MNHHRPKRWRKAILIIADCPATPTSPRSKSAVGAKGFRLKRCDIALLAIAADMLSLRPSGTGRGARRITHR
jgi:hypothetical protein